MSVSYFAGIDVSKLYLDVHMVAAGFPLAEGDAHGRREIPTEPTASEGEEGSVHWPHLHRRRSLD